MRDKKTIKNIITGEIEYVDILIEKYYGDVYSYCYHHLFDKNMAQDITQETFLHLLRNIDKYEHKGKLINYLYVIAKNLIRDYIKRTDIVYLNKSNESSEYYDIDNVVLKLDIKTILASFEEDERELIILRYYQDMTFINIAKIVGKPVSTVRHLLKKIEKKVSDNLKGEY